MLKMLVTRPEPDASETAARLAALDIEPVLEPLLIHETLPTSLPDPSGFAAMALSSASALRALHERGALARYTGLRLFAVGDRSATVARSFGFTDVISAGGSFADLVERLAHARLPGPVFYPAGIDRVGDLARSLAAFGVMVITTQVYRMRPAAALSAGVRDALAAGQIAAALFYSRRTAETFLELAAAGLDRRTRTRLGVLCLSEAVASPLVDAHFVRVGLADHPSEEAMMSLALSFARDQNPA
jgi:uroporphyrinogen-III synthase